MRGAAAIIAFVVAAVVGVAARGAASPPPPIVPCDDIIGQAESGHDSGYRLVLGFVSVPPARLVQVVATHATPWAYWRKAGLVIRASHTPVSVRVPQTWRKRAAITWGSSGTVSSLRIAACPSPPNVWNAYAGGFYIRSRSACVPLIFQVGQRSKTVRFGIGRTCGAAR
jgi:hypothetical protein